MTSASEGMTAQPSDPDGHETIHLGGETAVVVPLHEYRTLRALREHAPADLRGCGPFADASPAEVRAGLPPEDVAAFDAEWHAAMSSAEAEFDLSGVRSMLDSWRINAFLFTRDPADYRRMLETAAKLQRGEYVHTVTWDEARPGLLRAWRERAGAEGADFAGTEAALGAHDVFRAALTARVERGEYIPPRTLTLDQLRDLKAEMGF